MAKKKGIKIAMVGIDTYDGERIQLPARMTLPKAIEVLTRENARLSEEVHLQEVIEGFVPDVAHAFYRAAEQIFGYVHTRKSLFRGASEITVRSGVNESVQVPVGRFELPGVDGTFATDTEFDPATHRYKMALHANILRRDEAVFHDMVAATRKYLAEHSIYKGKAFRLSLNDSDGNAIPFPEPQFIRIDTTLKDRLIFAADVDAAIRTSVFAPITHREKGRARGLSPKRGVLLHGTFGTGKSMTSAAVADLATANGWTFIHAEDATELSDILRLAREYAPSVVFAEDVDKVTSGRRTLSMDELLNVVDGIESKNSDVMVVFTTNTVHNINPAMLRPGRLDSVIEVKPPDAQAVTRLILQYGDGLVSEEENLLEIGLMLAGEVPAVVEEVVKRSKWAAIDRDPEADLGPGAITADDLMVAALSMKNQIDLLRGEQPDDRSDPEKAAAITAEAIRTLAPVSSAKQSANGSSEAVAAAATA